MDSVRSTWSDARRGRRRIVTPRLDLWAPSPELVVVEGRGGGVRVLRVVDSGRYIGSRAGSKTGTAAAAREDRDGVVGAVRMRGRGGGARVRFAFNTVCTKASNDMALRGSSSVTVASSSSLSVSSIVSSLSVSSIMSSRSNPL